jgi:hypothetical protein
MVRVFPTIKRFFGGTASIVAGSPGDVRGHLNRTDFMTSDLTGSAGHISR